MKKYCTLVNDMGTRIVLRVVRPKVESKHMWILPHILQLSQGFRALHNRLQAWIQDSMKGLGVPAPPGQEIANELFYGGVFATIYPVLHEVLWTATFWWELYLTVAIPLFNDEPKILVEDWTLGIAMLNNVTYLANQSMQKICSQVQSNYWSKIHLHMKLSIIWPLTFIRICKQTRSFCTKTHETEQ